MLAAKEAVTLDRHDDETGKYGEGKRVKQDWDKTKAGNDLLSE